MRRLPTAILIIGLLAYSSVGAAASRVLVVGYGTDEMNHDDIDAVSRRLLAELPRHEGFSIVHPEDFQRALQATQVSLGDCLQDWNCVEGVAKKLGATSVLLAFLSRTGERTVLTMTRTEVGASDGGKRAVAKLKPAEPLDAAVDHCLTQLFDFQVVGGVTPQQPAPQPQEEPARAAPVSPSPAAAPETSAAMPPPAMPAPVPVSFHPSTNPGDTAVIVMGVPIRISASITLRYDYSTFADQEELYQDGIFASGFRARTRLGFDFGDAHSQVVGGIRFALGENPNPTVSFVPLNQAGFSRPFGADMWWGSWRPFEDRDLAALTIGKFPNPNWRGDGPPGTYRDQLVWDNDVQPEGLNVHLTFFKTGSSDMKWKIENNLGFYSVNDIPTTLFTGITGLTTQVAEQLHVTLPFAGVAAAFYDYKNLNNGLVAPSFLPGSAFPVSASVTGQNAWLLRGGVWGTNNRVNYGPGAAGFVTDEFQVLNLVGQLHFPVYRFTKILGNDAELYTFLDYTHNFSVKQDGNGYGVTFGLHIGDWSGGWLHPFNIEFTYRDVDADAVLATFADSDLGAGTDYYGWEITANYRIVKNMMVQIAYFDFVGYPLKDNQWNRLFTDIVMDF